MATLSYRTKQSRGGGSRTSLPTLVPTLGWCRKGLSRSRGDPEAWACSHRMGNQSPARLQLQGLSYLGPAHLDPRPCSAHGEGGHRLQAGRGKCGGRGKEPRLGSPSWAQGLFLGALPILSERHGNRPLPALLPSGDKAVLGGGGPKDSGRCIHLLMPGAHERDFMWKRDSADVIKVGTLK